MEKRGSCQKKLAKTYNEAMLDIVERWKASGGVWPATPEEIALFAVNNKLYEQPKKDIVKQCARDIARTMREAHYTDPQGRKVRTLHAARYRKGDQDGQPKQEVLWDDIRTAKREHMENAFGLRRTQIVGDCWQLKTDADSYNENHPEYEPIQLVFDFTSDVEERNLPEEYEPGNLGD